MRKVAAVLAVCLLPLLLLARPQRNPQKSLVLDHVTVIDGTGAPAQSDMTVVITGGRIRALDKSGKVQIPKQATSVDGAGKFLIPGLWDMHVHIFNHAPLRPPNEFYFPLFIASGVTGVRDMWTKAGDLSYIRQWRREIAEGARIGPQIAAVGTMVDGPGSPWPGAVTVATAAEARRAVDAIKQAQVDFVKVQSMVPREAYFALVDEAKKQHIPFAGHVPVFAGALAASEAGQKSFEHLYGLLMACSDKEAELQKEMWEVIQKPGAPVQEYLRGYAQGKDLLDSFSEKKAADLFAHLRKNGTWQVPTLVPNRAKAFGNDRSITGDLRLKYIPNWMRDSWNAEQRPGLTTEQNAMRKRFFQKELEIVGAMRRAGVEFLAGTDLNNPFVFPGFSLHDELALFVQAGFTPMEALQTATRNPAAFLGKLTELGTVEKGKIADLVLLDGNPLEDIRYTQKIAAVVVGGRYLPRSELDRMLTEAELAASKK